MSDPRDEARQPASEDERFARTLSEQYAPEPPSPARAREFDAALRERLDAPAPQSVWRPALATAVVCAAIGWLLLPPAQPQPSDAGSVLVVDADLAPGVVALAELVASDELADADADALADWEAELFGTSVDREVEDEFLPDDYLAIRLWLDG